MKRLPRRTLLVGDAARELSKLPAHSVDSCITSPPYYMLRDYGMDNQIGLEATVDQWVDELRLVMRGVARVLKPTATVWLNCGDSYSRHARFGAPPKGLLLAPERLALGLAADGWRLRNRIAWVKSNTMPNSARDRLACTWEFVYLLVRSDRYFFDLDAVRVPPKSTVRRSQRPVSQTNRGRPAWAGPLAGSNSGLARMKASGQVSHPLGKNPGDVISTPASNYRGAHFATFPEDLIERPVLAGCPERVCSRCGIPWERQPVDRTAQVAVLGQLRPSCDCHDSWQPGVVLDPFFGTGTVGVVAEKFGRDWIGIELNPAYGQLAKERLATAQRRVDNGGGQRVA